MKMKYSLGCNFDPDLIDYLNEIDKDHQIETLFGKLRKDIFGGGRASNVLPDISMKEFEKYITKCSKSKIGFNYLLNPMCLGNREFTPSENKKMIKFIDQLYQIGIRHVTVNSPYLCELIKKRYDDIQVTIGLYAYIYTSQHVRYWEDIGADELTLHHRINRNFEELKNIMLQTKNSKIKLRLIANNVCLHDCPYQLSHVSGMAHASQRKDESKCIYFDYYLMKCNYHKIKNTQALLASEWIRPEDVHYYTRLCEETGNNNFSIKLLDRTKNTDFLKRVATAYLAEEYKGNLVDLLNLGTSKNTKEYDKKGILWKSIFQPYNITQLQNLKNVYQLPEINIDNTKLDGFLDHFKNGYACTEAICGLNDKIKANGRCDYCNKWAEKVISYNDEERNLWMNQTEEALSSMVSCKIYKR